MNNNNYSHDPAYAAQQPSPTRDYDALVAEIQRLDQASESKGMQALITIGASIAFGIWMLVIDRPASLIIAAFGIGMGWWLAKEGGELSNAADELRSQLPATPPSAATEYVTLSDGRTIPRERYEDIASRTAPATGQAPTGNSQGHVNNPSSFDDISDEDGF